MTTIWDPITLAGMDLPHRFALAPMTRSRAQPDGTPGPLAAQYYAQRAELGLLITEGTQPSDDGQGYLTTPGIYTPRHIEGWRAVTEAVHARGAHLFIQLMHAGRISHPDNTAHHRTPLAPSAITPSGSIVTPSGPQPYPQPREMTAEDIRRTIADFRHAAAYAREAGADGVEIHGANGYLLDQFLAPNTNHRTDAYGGGIENRTRLTLEVAAAVAQEIGADHVGIRLSPGNHAGDLDEGPEGPALYHHLVSELDRLGLAYLSLFHFDSEEVLRDLRDAWHAPLLLLRAGRPVTLESLEPDIESGLADVQVLGSSALANPDIVTRLRTGAPLNAPDRDTLYSGGAHGYTDYPSLSS